MTLGSAFVDLNVIASALFSPEMPVEDAVKLLPLLQRESRRVMVEAYWPQVIDKPTNLPPALVIGGDQDCFVPELEMRRAARLWKATLKIIPELPHGFMMDPTWRLAADEIKQWLDEKKWPISKG
jgi:pimeloyl-ACP methyl ester carboxylesterase